MPGTWREIMRAFNIKRGNPYNAKLNIYAGSYYLSRMLKGWTAERTKLERMRFGLASYNCGFGCVLIAQKKVDNSLLFSKVRPKLPRETRNYVSRIERFHSDFKARELE
jgi:membrane-bound lytic murein transglycosylase MltF